MNNAVSAAGIAFILALDNISDPFATAVVGALELGYTLVIHAACLNGRQIDMYAALAIDCVPATVLGCGVVAVAVPTDRFPT